MPGLAIAAGSATIASANTIASLPTTAASLATTFPSLHPQRPAGCVDQPTLRFSTYRVYTLQSSSPRALCCSSYNDATGVWSAEAPTHLRPIAARTVLPIARQITRARAKLGPSSTASAVAHTRQRSSRRLTLNWPNQLSAIVSAPVKMSRVPDVDSLGIRPNARLRCNRRSCTAEFAERVRLVRDVVLLSRNAS